MPLNGAPATSRHPLLLVVVLFGLVASLAIGAWWYTLHKKNDTSLGFAIVLGLTQVGNVWTINSATGALNLFTITDGNGNDLSVIDVVKGSGGDIFYLLADSPTAVNLYEKSEDGSLTKLSNSDTVKYGLSYDPASNAFAYQAKLSTEIRNSNSGDDWEVTVFSRESLSERVVGVGTHSSIMADGGFLAVQRGTKLLLLDSVSGAEYPLMDLPSTPKLSLNGTAGTIALYNPVTKQIDTFTTSRATLSAAYVGSSAPLITEPDAIGVIDNEIVSVYLDMQSQEVAYKFFNTVTGEEFVATHAQHKGIPQRLIPL